MKTKRVGWMSSGALYTKRVKFFWFSKTKRDGYDIPIYTDEKLYKKGKKMAKKIVAPALKEKKTGVIIEAPSKKWAHDQLEAKEHKKDKEVKKGFVTNDDKFVKRKKAAEIAKQAGQIKKPIKKLHSSDLRKAEGIKKKVIK
jgi:hypothetical protein